MELGYCKVSSLGYKCSCKAGTYTSTTGIFDGHALCIVCSHPISRHNDYIEPSPPPSAVLKVSTKPSKQYTEAHPDICPREQTVQTLARLLDEHRVIHVRGTPASGKTTLSFLLCDYLKGTEKVLLLSKWECKRTASDYLATLCREYGYDGVESWDIRSSSFVFIIDEAQQTYVDTEFWYGLIKTQIGRCSGPRFCLFSVYGSPRTGAVDYPISITPPVLESSQRVSLIKSSDPDAPDIEFTLNRRLEEYIYSLTNGYPGMVEHVLIYVRNFYRSHLKRRNVNVIALEHVQGILNDNRKLFHHLENSPAGRSLPSTQNNRGIMEPGMIKGLLSVLRDGSILFDRYDENMLYCFHRGWVHSEETESGQLICLFPSNLHARFVEWSYGRDSAISFPCGEYQDLKDFCFEVLQRFSTSMLRRTREGARIGPSGARRPPEAAFKDEFYRCYWDEVGDAAGICSEWSGDNQGCIDFLIPEPGWGIGLLHDGDRISDHLSRFHPNGTYHSWIQRGILKDWLILDCRYSLPETTYPNEPKLWRVVFQNDYTEVHILDCNSVKVVPEFRLSSG